MLCQVREAAAVALGKLGEDSAAWGVVASSQGSPSKYPINPKQTLLQGPSEGQAVI